MTNSRKETIHWIITGLLVIATIRLSPFFGGNLSAKEAFRASEAGIYYGPSEIIEVVDYGDVKIYLARYKNWVSASGVRKQMLQWFPTTSIPALEIDEAKAINYDVMNTETIRRDKQILRIYGSVNDEAIKTVQLFVQDESSEELILEAELQENLFMFHWDNEVTPYTPIKIVGLDEAKRVIFQEKLERWPW